MDEHHPPTPSSKEEGEKRAKAPSPSEEGEKSRKAPSALEDGENSAKAPSSLEEGVGGGGVTRKVLLERARHMRNNPTERERRLRVGLRARQCFGYKFRRQDVIGWRIVDFFCPAKGLAIEIDGDTHDRARDLARDRSMERELAFRVIRFTNEEVMRNCDGVLVALQLALDAKPERWANRREHHPPTHSSEEEGEKKRRRKPRRTRSRRKAPSSLEEGVGGGGV